MVLPVCAGACKVTMSEAFGFRKGNALDGEWCDLEFAGSERLKAGRFPAQARHARHPNAH
jgi:hypothetical protein